MATHTLTIPRWHPARVNQLYHGHWAVRKRLKDASRQTVAAHALVAGIPKARGKRRVGLLIRLKPRQRGGDVDAYFKDALDCLVSAGLLVDDNGKHAELEPVRYERGTADDWGTVVTLTDVDDGGQPAP